jgi:NADPH:quinone reductase-like Zn-dependent oxidoreductase
LAATGGKGVEVIIDQVSASVANGNLKCCAILGRIVNVGRLGGFAGEFDFDLHAARRIKYIGVTFRSSMEFAYPFRFLAALAALLIVGANLAFALAFAWLHWSLRRSGTVPALIAVREENSQEPVAV